MYKTCFGAERPLEESWIIGFSIDSMKIDEQWEYRMDPTLRDKNGENKKVRKRDTDDHGLSRRPLSRTLSKS